MGSYIIGIDVETGEAQFYETPTRNSMPRRARMDAQDRFWFAEYTGDRIGMFDTRTQEFQEWPLPHQLHDAVHRDEPRQERLRLCVKQHDGASGAPGSEDR